MRQGPHHSAQKSTSTGPFAASTSWAKLSSVTLIVCSLIEVAFFPVYLPGELVEPNAGSSTHLHCTGRMRLQQSIGQKAYLCVLRPNQGTANRFCREDLGKHRAVGSHLPQIKHRCALRPFRRRKPGLVVGELNLRFRNGESV